MPKLIFLGCLSLERYQETCDNAIRIIHFLDSDFQVLDDTPCCGSLLFHTASDEELKNHMNFVLEWFQKNKVSEVVTICAGCYNYFTKYYSELLNEDFNLRVHHILQFMSAPQNLKKLNLNYHRKAISVSYHDACHLRNSSVPIIEEPRIILNSIENIKLRELDNNKLNSICCGSGGGVYSSFKGNSDYNTNLILNEIKRVKILLTACPFCYTAFNRVREENNIKTLVMKFEDFIIKIMKGGKILS